MSDSGLSIDKFQHALMPHPPRYHSTEWNLRDILIGLRIRIFKMFGPFRLHPELGGGEIVNPSEAAMFIQRLNPADKGKPHWRLAMSMIETAASSDEQEARASSAFANALRTEMWLED